MRDRDGEVQGCLALVGLIDQCVGDVLGNLARNLHEALARLSIYLPHVDLESVEGDLLHVGEVGALDTEHLVERAVAQSRYAPGVLDIIDARDGGSAVIGVAVGVVDIHDIVAGGEQSCRQKCHTDMFE